MCVSELANNHRLDVSVRSCSKFIEFKPRARSKCLNSSLRSFNPCSMRHARAGISPRSSAVSSRSMGFDSFMCGFSSTPRPNRNAQLYVFTTLPREWVQIYDEKHTSKLTREFRSYTTDQHNGGLECRGSLRSISRVEQISENAARFGVRSGACFTLARRQSQRSSCLLQLLASRKSDLRIGRAQSGDALRHLEPTFMKSSCATSWNVAFLLGFEVPR